jgi:hypothetical protein
MSLLRGLCKAGPGGEVPAVISSAAVYRGHVTRALLKLFTIAPAWIKATLNGRNILRSVFAEGEIKLRGGVKHKLGTWENNFASDMAIRVRHERIYTFT